MKKRKNQHVVPAANGWSVLGEGNSRKTKNTATKNEAIVKARAISINQKSELIIHGKDGKIKIKDSFGNDTFPPKG